MNRLRLREHKRVHTSRRLLRRQPLQPRRVRTGLVSHPHTSRFRRQHNRQGRPKYRIRRPKRIRSPVKPTHRRPTFHGANVQISRIKDQRVRTLCDALKRQHRRRTQLLLVEQNSDIKFKMRHADFIHIRIGMRVTPCKIYHTVVSTRIHSATGHDQRG